MYTPSPAEEILPLTAADQFFIFSQVTDNLNHPVHYHHEYELCLILKGRGLKRIVGSNIEVTDDVELVILGPNLPHGWNQHNCKSKIELISIGFNRTSLPAKYDQEGSLANLLQKAHFGITFTSDTAETVTQTILNLVKLSLTDFIDEFFPMLHYLAGLQEQRILSEQAGFEDHEKLKQVRDYIKQHHASRISLDEVSAVAGMSMASFNRFIKKNTGSTFVNYLNSIRVGYASRWLTETDLSIAEIASTSGFNNIANFNRIFKSNRNITPGKYRENYFGLSRYI